MPFDALRVASSSLDNSDWIGVAVQAALCVLCFSHYGLIKAAFTKKPERAVISKSDSAGENIDGVSMVNGKIVDVAKAKATKKQDIL